MTKTKDSGWSYYVPDQGEDATDATPINLYDWQVGIFDQEDAAERAAEDDWDNRDGWEAGVGDGPVVVVISPKGDETRYSTYREATVVHSVRAHGKEQADGE